MTLRHGAFLVFLALIGGQLAGRHTTRIIHPPLPAEHGLDAGGRIAVIVRDSTRLGLHATDVT